MKFVRRVCFASVVLLLAFCFARRGHAADVVGQAFDTDGFAYSMESLVTGYEGMPPLTNFPVLVRVPRGAGSACGYDVRAVAADGTLLAHEVERWSMLGAEPAVWVRVPVLTNNTPLTLVWGNPDALPPEDSPTNIAGLAGWYAAEDLTGQPDGTVVNAWPDRSGNTNTFVRTLGNPIIVHGVPGRGPVVRFDGTDDRFRVTNSISVGTAFFVMKEDADASANWRCILATSTNTVTPAWHRGPNRLFWSPVYGSPNVYGGETWVDGASVGNGQGERVPTDYCVVAVRLVANEAADQLGGDRTFVDRSWKGDCAEVLLYDRRLTDEELARVGRYLSQKHGLSTRYAYPEYAAGPAVWTNDFAIVQHLGERNPVGLYAVGSDAGAVAQVATASPTRDEGIAGYARTYPAGGATYASTVAYPPIAATFGRFTAEFVTRCPAGTIWGDWLGIGSSNMTVRIELDDGGQCNLYNDGGAPYVIADSATTVNDGDWHHVALVADQTADVARLYVDGFPDGSTVAWDTNAPIAVVSLGAVAGRNAINGAIDEFRLSSAARSPEWLRAEAMNAISNAAFVVSSPPINTNAPVVAALAVTNVTATRAELRAEITDTNGSPVTVRGGEWALSVDELYTTPVRAVTETGTFGAGEYTITLVGLPPASRVYCRAVAANASGANYSEDVLTIDTPPRALPITNGLTLWLDASALDGLADGDVVTNFWDGSGNERHALKQVGNPTFVADGFNGRPAVHLDGANGNYFAFPRLTDMRTAFVVLREDPAATGLRFVVGDATATDWHRGVTNQWTAGRNAIWNGTYAGQMVQDTRLDGAFIDGTRVPMPTQAAVLSVRTRGPVANDRIGDDRNSVGRNWYGDVAEVIMYNRVLSDVELALLSRALAGKYGLTSAFATVSLESRVNVSPAQVGIRGTFVGVTGQTAVVRCCWGATNAGETVAAWDNTRTLAEDVSAPMSFREFLPVAPGTTGVCRLVAELSGGGADWSLPVAFETPRPLDGVLAHWTFDETGGTVAHEATRRRNLNGVMLDGTLSGGVTLATNGVFGSAVHLDGVTNSYITIPFLDGIHDGAYTFAAWIRTADAGINTIISDWSSVWAFRFFATGTAISFAHRYASGADTYSYVAPADTVSVGQWHHVAATWDPLARTAIAYVDGAPVVTSVTAVVSNQLDMVCNNRAYHIGWKEDSTDTFAGDIDELWVVDRALSADELSTLMNDNTVAPVDERIAVNFVGGRTPETAPAPLLPAELAGVGQVAQPWWNNAATGSGSLANLRNAAGEFTTAQVVWRAGDGTWALDTPDGPANYALMKGFLYTWNNDGTNTLVTVTNLPAHWDGYDIYVYFDTDNGNAWRKTAFTATDGAGRVRTDDGEDTENADFDSFVVGGLFQHPWPGGTANQRFPYGPNNDEGNWLRLGGMHGTGFRLEVYPTGGSALRAPLNGLQIVATSYAYLPRPPGTLLMVR